MIRIARAVKRALAIRSRDGAYSWWLYHQI